MSNASSPADLLRIEVERRDQTAIIRLAGSAHMDAAEDLQSRLIRSQVIQVAPL